MVSTFVSTRFDSARFSAFRRSGLALLGVAVLTSCGDNPVAPFVPVATTVVLGTSSATFTAIGESQVVTASVRDQNGGAMGGLGVGWTSSDPAVVMVTAEGLLTAVGNGVTVVSAQAGAAADSLDVTVAQIATALDLAPDSVVLSDPGDTLTVSLAARDMLGMNVAGPTVTWSSSDVLIATVDSTGLVTAVATGSVVVSAQVDSEVSAIGVRVEPELTVPVAGPDSVEAVVATDVALSVLVEDLLGAAYGGAVVQWSVDAGGGQIVSSAQSVSDGTGHTAAVWELGTGAGLQRASASITTRGQTVVADFVASARAGAPVSANLVADSVLLSAKGETVFLAPSYADVYGNPTDGTGVTFTSRDPAVVDVALDGLVTGQGAGSTYVTTSFAAPSDSILVTVALRGAITITFDDGWLTTYTEAYPVFQEFNLPANVAVNPGVVTFPAYMPLANLQELHNAGWSMVSHTMTHANLTTLSDAELDFELRKSKEYLDAQGFNGTDIFIVPYHDWGVRERNAAAEHYRVARGVAANFFAPDSLVQWMPSNPYDLTGMEADVLPFTTVQGRDRLRAMLDRTVNEGVFLDLFFHQMPTANVQALRDTLTIIDQYRERVLPYHELYPRFARTVF